MSATSIQLEMVAPERQLISQEVDMVTVPGSEGYFGVLPGHMPVLTTLSAGRVTVGSEPGAEYYAVSGGFVEVIPDRVVMLVDQAISQADIDKQQCKKDLGIAKRSLSDMNDQDPDYPGMVAKVGFLTACVDVAES